MAPKQLAREIVIWAIALPVVGIFMGGIWSLPASKLAGGREARLIVLLGVALGLTVATIGRIMSTPPIYLFGTWLLALVLLAVARLAFGNLTSNIEKFGFVHAATVMATVMVSLCHRVMHQAS